MNINVIQFSEPYPISVWVNDECNHDGAEEVEVYGMESVGGEPHLSAPTRVEYETQCKCGAYWDEYDHRWAY